jgi:hypothetical protein
MKRPGAQVEKSAGPHQTPTVTLKEKPIMQDQTTTTQECPECGHSDLHEPGGPMGVVCRWGDDYDTEAGVAYCRCERVDEDEEDAS